MRAPHVCKFDSRQGFVSDIWGTFLMCRCGDWSSAHYGYWHVTIPEILPPECEMKTRLRSIRNVLLNCICALSFGLLMALLVCPEAFR